MKSLVFAIATALVFATSGMAVWERSIDDAPDAQATKAAPLKPEEMDKLLAPVALYPDQLLSQMLISAQNPGKVGALNEWLTSQKLTGTELQDAAKKAGFDGSYVALVLFPQVVNYMASMPEWTAKLGQSFTADPKGVFGSIQRLRSKAQQAGKLKSNPQQQVETKTTSSGEQVIVIEPANPQVVYVPQYNPTTVYTAPTSSTVVIKEEDNSDAAVAAGLIGFTAGIAIGAAIDNDYYYGPYGMHGGFYMYNDAWDDWYDDREDAREDWYDNREDLAEERTDRAKNAQEERTDRTEARQENRPETQAQRDQRKADAQAKASSPEGQQRKADAQAKASEARSSGATAGTASAESRGYTGGNRPTSAERSGTKSDAFSGYSSGKSERAASQRGQRSRSSSGSRSGGSRRR